MVCLDPETLFVGTQSIWYFTVYKVTSTDKQTYDNVDKSVTNTIVYSSFMIPLSIMPQYDEFRERAIMRTTFITFHKVYFML